MDVLIIEPERVPRLAEISGDLESLQGIVGGLIEAVYPFDDPVALICNEEGKLLGLPLNRELEDYDIIAGTFLICGLSEDDFDSLPPDMVRKYQKQFADPEIFLQIGGQILAIPMPPAEDPDPQLLTRTAAGTGRRVQG